MKETIEFDGEKDAVIVFGAEQHEFYFPQLEAGIAVGENLVSAYTIAMLMKEGDKEFLELIDDRARKYFNSSDEQWS